MELKDDVLQYLGEGYRVELGEFGFFSAKVKASRLVANKNDIRSADSVRTLTTNS